MPQIHTSGAFATSLKVCRLYFPLPNSIRDGSSNPYPKLQERPVHLIGFAALFTVEVPLPKLACASQCLANLDSLLIDESLFEWCCEQSQISRAVPSRQHEFAAGRQCAANALQSLGESGRVQMRSDRSPVWPKGFVGSISHTKELVWAAAASTKTTLSLGIDVEKIADAQTIDEIQGVVASAKETELLTELVSSREVGVTLAFSAKEAVYKCIAPLGVNWLNFLDVELVVQDDGASVFCQLPQELNWQTASAKISEIEVHYEIHDDHVFTFCFIPNRLARQSASRVA